MTEGGTVVRCSGQAGLSGGNDCKTQTNNELERLGQVSQLWIS
jgi:hypothetical protein